MLNKQPLDFRSEAQRSFHFLVATYDMSDPEYSEWLLPVVRYRRPDLQIHVALESGDGAGMRVAVGVGLPHCDWPARAGLSDLVEAAEFGPRHLVPEKAHNAEVARTTLDANAVWLERLMPLLLGPGSGALVRRATEHPVDRAGNPKRRSSRTKWKYA